MIEGFPATTRRWLITVMVVAAVVGFTAGLAGELFSQTVILNTVFSNDLLTELNGRFFELLTKYQLISQTDTDQPLELVIRRSTSGSLENIKSVEVGGLISATLNSSAFLFTPLKGSTTDVLANAYLPQLASGQAIVITNDGWLLTVTAALPANRQAMAVVGNNAVGTIERVITDPLTDFVFVKVPARNLSVASYSKTVTPQAGQAVIIPLADGGVITTMITSPDYRLISRTADAIMTSETLDTTIAVADDISQAAIGAPVVTANGSVVGLVSRSANDQAIILPLSSVVFHIDSVLGSGAFIGPTAGLTYLSLADLALGQQVADHLRQLGRGALIYRAPTAPAGTAGLKIGDVILKVEGEEVNATTSLTDLVQSYNAGSVVNLSVWRDGAEQTIPLTLGRLTN